ncbi:MAG: glycosyltransferase family 39 protein [Acidobacteriota bacterium]
MSEVTKNPPPAAYFGALIGSWAGWSEYTLHLAFLLPALAVVLGVYHLAREFAESPLLAAVITLVAPGFPVSCTSIMSDVPMLDLWIAAVLLWREGLESGKPLHLAGSGLLIAAAMAVMVAKMQRRKNRLPEVPPNQFAPMNMT